ncbi:MAG TPA: FkbM family methyltransferase [Pyrinomonadaceae bacterium]
MKNRAAALVRKFMNPRATAYASFMEVERAERLFYLEFLRAGMTVFDVGAHIGELTLMFARFVGDLGRVYSFEPSSESFKRLAATCAAASLRNVQLNSVAVGDQVGEVTLHSYGEGYLSFTSQAVRPLQNYGINIHAVAEETAPATTIDTYCKANDVTSIDLLKIDVEGAEFQVMLGARRMLEERRVRCIAFEFGQTTFDMKNDPTEVESYLRKVGYLVRNVVKSDPVFPGRDSTQSACFSMHIATPVNTKSK